MTFEEIDARYRTAVLSGDAEEDWDDPEDVDDDDDELGYRNADEEQTYDERGDQGPDEAP
jgi:hypothetical protein